MPNGHVEVFDRRLDPTGAPRRRGQPGRALQRKAGHEQALNHRVVQITSTMRSRSSEQRQSMQVFAASVLLDDDAGLTPESVQHLDFGLAERGSPRTSAHGKRAEQVVLLAERNEHGRSERPERDLRLPRRGSRDRSPRSGSRVSRTCAVMLPIRSNGGADQLIRVQAVRDMDGHGRPSLGRQHDDRDVGTHELASTRRDTLEDVVGIHPVEEIDAEISCSAASSATRRVPVGVKA